MKKYLLLFLLSFLAIKDIQANHTKGGWMYYQYLGPGIIDPTMNRYRIGLNLYIDCGSTLIEPTWNFSFFSGRSPYNFIQDIGVNASPDYLIDGCTSLACYPCISNVPARCYKIINYETIVELAPSTDGYIISKQRCCRIAGISNIQPPSTNHGATWTIKIPGTNQAPTAPQNSSPVFIFNDTVVVCGDNPFSMNFTATDINSDSLVYSFVDAYTGGTTGAPNPNTASNPPYSTVPYLAPYTGTLPLGSGVTINPQTGVISGVAPPPGEYVICILVREYRPGGIYIGESRKEIHLRVAPCTPLIANPSPDYTSCDGFTVNFYHNSSGANNVFWDFGDPSTLADTSWLDNPTYTYADTGVFIIRFIINRNQACTDTAYRTIRVFPGFFPGFLVSPALCVGRTINFTDTTRTNYGVVDSWSWNFGDPSTLADTSHLQNPSYTYSTPGLYTVQLVVTNSKGCQKLVTKDITINANPLLSVFPSDTTYCGLDTLQLTATGTGSFNWTPPVNIIGANTATPQVFPNVPTKYYVTLTDAFTCFSRDSVMVTPKFDLNNAIAANPTAICEEDTLTLSGSSNYAPNVSWQWNPVATVETPTGQVTRAYPIVTTNYTLTTRWGNNCVVTANQNIVVTPLAIPNAGPDAAICGGQQAAQLNATGGDNYQWSPVTGLSDPNIPNPVASPAVTTMYTVSVGVTGCSKRRVDSVEVHVRPLPALSTINDTLICNIDDLTLTTTGTGSFAWSPNYNISSTTAQSPVVSPDVPTMYRVRLTDALGCYSEDSVFVDVVDSVSLAPFPDTTICRTDGMYINTVSDGLSYVWSPNIEINSITDKRPYVTPSQDRTYTVTASIGGCSNTRSINIKVVPYPAANAGPDAALCPGFSTQLSASGGTNYAWSPSTFLSDPLISNPQVINPTATIRYIVTVRDTLGCPKPVKDTMWVRVYPRPIANAGPRDTTVVQGEPLFLFASGGVDYLWDPITWLNNPGIFNPVSIPMDNIEYNVRVTDANGCIARDTINVLVYNMEEGIYVPNAFTPNGDGNNDVIRPILLGMRELTFFRVYNRFGQMVFSTSEIGKGWDGIFGGRGQDPGTFVWMAEGVSYKGQVKKKKGHVILIRQ